VKLTQNARLAECTTCGQRVIAGICGSTLKPIVLDIVVLDIQAFIELGGTKLYALGMDNRIEGPLKPGTRFPMNEWRPKHPHPWTEPVYVKPSWHEPLCASRNGAERLSGALDVCTCPDPPSSPPVRSTVPMRAEDDPVRLLIDGLGAVFIERITRAT
jgi:hypothetical protein